RLYIVSEDFDGYSKLETGLRAELLRKITKKFEIGAFAWAREVEVNPTGIDPLELGPTSYLVNSVGLTQTLDLRDTAVNTSRGLVFNASEDVASSAIGSSINFMRATFRISYYVPIKKTLLAFGARAGIIKPFGDTDQIPIDERFFNGGSRSVRSFSERELGPRDINKFPVGGETFSTFNIEYTIPVVGDLAVAVFTDAGSIGRTVGDGVGEMRYGVGAGLRYKLPVGPLRLDYGINPSPKGDEASGAFHFSFGFAF
ncbi:MAG: outer membrane protein assembly factor, partial [Verrucomicrobiota bacterium]|nr:outer membrane protein assembly factor [Verrucomicrobiota bacterium]